MGRTNSSRRPSGRWGREGRDREALRLPGGPGAGAREGGRGQKAAPPFLYRALPRVPGPIRQSMSHWPFRSTPPRGRGDRGRCPQKGPRTHFDPRLRKEGDWRRAPRPGRSQSFDPRPPVRGRRLSMPTFSKMASFRSTPPGATCTFSPFVYECPANMEGVTVYIFPLQPKHL